MTEGRTPPPDTKRAGTVLDPAFEKALVSAQEAEGEAGGLDADLAVVHLLRHAREPEVMTSAELDHLWSAIETEAMPKRRWFGLPKWVFVVTPLAAAAAVLLIVVLPRDPTSASTELARNEEKPSVGAVERKSKGEAPSPPAASAPPKAADEVAASPARAGAPGLADGLVDTRSSGAAASERMFAQLAPGAKGELLGAVESSRNVLRADLIATARAAGKGG